MRDAARNRSCCCARLDAMNRPCGALRCCGCANSKTRRIVHELEVWLFWVRGKLVRILTRNHFIYIVLCAKDDPWRGCDPEGSGWIERNEAWGIVWECTYNTRVLNVHDPRIYARMLPLGVPLEVPSKARVITPVWLDSGLTCRCTPCVPNLEHTHSLTRDVGMNWTRTRM